MAEQTQDINATIGHKTFFVGADTTILPETFLEDLVAYGFEAYRIQESSAKVLQQKLELTAQLFPNSFFFFYIDMPLTGLKWQEIIQQFTESHVEDASSGLLYTKRSSENDCLLIERRYKSMNLKCGAIELGLKRTQNFPLFLVQLEKCGARGKRKNIRVHCGASSTVTFFIREANKRISAAMMDFSINHFSCIISKDDEMPPYDTYEDVLVQTSGIRFRTNCKRIMDRDSASGRLCVFVFLQKNGVPGLGDDTKFKVQSKIYELATDPIRLQQQEAYSVFLKYKREDIPLEAVCAQAMQEYRLAKKKEQEQEHVQDKEKEASPS